MKCHVCVIVLNWTFQLILLYLVYRFRNVWMFGPGAVVAWPMTLLLYMYMADIYPMLHVKARVHRHTSHLLWTEDLDP